MAIENIPTQFKPFMLIFPLILILRLIVDDVVVDIDINVDVDTLLMLVMILIITLMQMLMLLIAPLLRSVVLSSICLKKSHQHLTDLTLKWLTLH